MSLRALRFAGSEIALYTYLDSPHSNGPYNITLDGHAPAGFIAQGPVAYSTQGTIPNALLVSHLAVWNLVAAETLA
jgi:hypothetical protein